MVRRRQDIIEAKITAQIEYLPTAGSSLLPLRKLRSVFILFCELAFSIGLPMIGLLVYMTYAETNGIKLEVGCHGPGVPFSMLSGILFTLIQRFKLMGETSPTRLQMSDLTSASTSEAR